MDADVLAEVGARAREQVGDDLLGCGKPSAFEGVTESEAEAWIDGDRDQSGSGEKSEEREDDSGSGHGSKPRF